MPNSKPTLRLVADTPQEAAALAGLYQHLVMFTSSDAVDEAAFDDGSSGTVGMVIDDVNFRAKSNLDPDHPHKDKHEAVLTVVLRPGQKGGVQKV